MMLNSTIAARIELHRVAQSCPNADIHKKKAELFSRIPLWTNMFHREIGLSPFLQHFESKLVEPRQVTTIICTSNKGKV